MAQRTVAYCDGKYIGIETIYTVIDGQQINIPEKLKELRAKSQSNRLFCPCGCGSNLILVAGDQNKREQHFRLKDGAFNQECRAVREGKTSISSKIILKCWLDDKLCASDLAGRVPIHAIGDTERKYEFTFISPRKHVALSYCRERANLSDEKFEILEANSQNMRIIYVVDGENAGTSGQYPEGLMKVQNRQGYCLFLTIEGTDYYKATLRAAIYGQNIDGFWEEYSIAEGKLEEFTVDEEGLICFKNNKLEVLSEQEKHKNAKRIEAERVRRAEEEARYTENLKKLSEEKERREKERRDKEKQELNENAEANCRRLKEEAEKIKTVAERIRAEEEKRQTEARKQEEAFKTMLENGGMQQDSLIEDKAGNRWVQCEFCKKIAKASEFCTYGGIGRINLGTCYDCLRNNPEVGKRREDQTVVPQIKYDPSRCPECGAMLREKNGKFGKFMGCSNYPSCRYTRRLG